MIGRVRGFAGPFGVFVRSYAYMRAYGTDLKAMSETAVLNANYVLAGLRDDYELPYDRHCMHEFVLSARTLKKELQIRSGQANTPVSKTSLTRREQRRTRRLRRG